MRIALSLWHNRISPLFDTARHLVVLEFEHGKILLEQEETFSSDDPVSRVAMLSRLGVRTLICGAISGSLASMIHASGIRTIPFVAGEREEVIGAYLANALEGPALTMPGCCRGRGRFGRLPGWTGEFRGKQNILDDSYGVTGQGGRDMRGGNRQESRGQGQGRGRGRRPGVGKSMVAVNLAVSLMLAGKRVGLLDVDIHGPSVPRMLGLRGERIGVGVDTLLPAEVGGIKVMSLGLLIPGDEDAVIWRGPLKMGMIKQFLKDVEWGELDFLIIDLPPGTGDEPLSVCQLIEDADGAVVVTTPQDVATSDVRRCITFCRQLKLSVLGVVENMSGFACPGCGKVTEIFKTGGGERMAREMRVPFLGSVPIDPLIAQACDAGAPYVKEYAQTETARAFVRIIEPILNLPDK